MSDAMIANMVASPPTGAVLAISTRAHDLLSGGYPEHLEHRSKRGVAKTDQDDHVVARDLHAQLIGDDVPDHVADRDQEPRGEIRGLGPYHGGEHGVPGEEPERAQKEGGRSPAAEDRAHVGGDAADRLHASGQ